MYQNLLALFLLLSINLVYGQETRLETILQKGHSKFVTCADFHPSGEFVVTGGYDNAIILWNLKSGKEIRVYNRHTASIWSVDFSMDGNQILSSSADQSIKLFNTRTGDLIHSMPFPKDDIRQAYFSYNGQHIIGLSNRDGLFVFDRISGKLIGNFKKEYGIGQYQYKRYAIQYRI
mgnify:CR=1 FL=1